MRAWVHEPLGATHWGKSVQKLRASCPTAYPANCPHFTLPCLYQGLSLVSSALPVLLLAVGKGKPLLFEKTTVPANPDGHKAREEAAVANQIRMRTQLRGGDPGLAGQTQAGRPPPQERWKRLLRGTSLSGSAVLGAEYG